VEETLRTIALLALLTLMVASAFAQKQKPKKSAESASEKSRRVHRRRLLRPQLPRRTMKKIKARGKRSIIASSAISRRTRSRRFRVVGQDNTYYFGGVAGGVWKPRMAA